MPCVPVTFEMAYLLEAPRGYPVSTGVEEQLRAMPKWEQARSGAGSCASVEECRPKTESYPGVRLG